MDPWALDSAIQAELTAVRASSSGQLAPDVLRRLDFLFQGDPVLDRALEHIDAGDVASAVVAGGGGGGGGESGGGAGGSSLSRAPPGSVFLVSGASAKAKRGSIDVRCVCDAA